MLTLSAVVVADEVTEPVESSSALKSSTAVLPTEEPPAEIIPTLEPSKAENIDLKQVVTAPLGEEPTESTAAPTELKDESEPLSVQSVEDQVSTPVAKGEATTEEPDETIQAGDSEVPMQADSTSDTSSPSKVITPDLPDQFLSPMPTKVSKATKKKAKAKQPLIILDAEVPPGTSTRLAWAPKMSFMGIAAPTAVLVINGVKEGPTLCLTAAVHGDELNGIEIVRHLLYDIKPEELAGEIIGVPIVNLQGFRRSSRYLPDRRDLNRYFPGNAKGSAASRTAHSFFYEVVKHCDMLVDLHTGSFHRTNLPQVRADLSNSKVTELAKGMGAIVVVQSKGHSGSLRRAAVESGVTAITLEAGQPHELQKSAVNHGIKSLENLMDSLGMVKRRGFWDIKAEPIYYKSRWVRSMQGGILFSDVELGDRIKKGDVMGTVTDPITNQRSKIRAPADGRIIGMALNQVMYPGFAAYHIGLQASAEAAAEDVELMEEIDEEAEVSEVDRPLESPPLDNVSEPVIEGETTAPVKVEQSELENRQTEPTNFDEYDLLEDSE